MAAGAVGPRPVCRLRGIERKLEKLGVLTAAMRTHTFARKKTSRLFLTTGEYAQTGSTGVRQNLTRYGNHSMFRGKFVTELVPSLVLRRGAQT
jgi:hypothetical protein